MKALLLLCLVACAAAPFSPDARPADQPGSPYTSVFAIQVHCPQHGEGQAQGGTAFVVGPHTLLTARHVATCDEGKAPTLVAVKWPGTNAAPIRAKLGETLDGVDVISIQVDVQFKTWLTVHPEGARQGDWLCFVSRAWFKKCGFAFTTSPTIGIATPTVRGNSGAPILDREGDVVGLLVAAAEQSVDDGREAAAFAVPATSWMRLVPQ